MRYNMMLAVLAAVALGCSSTDSGQETGGQMGQPEMQPAQQATDPMAAPSGEIDAALAGEGEGLFASKGCTGCHTLTNQRLIGPGLQGVTDRRPFEWVVAMVTNPDSMLANDAAAQALYAEYNTPMVNMGVSRPEARAIYEYLRSQ